MQKMLWLWLYGAVSWLGWAGLGFGLLLDSGSSECADVGRGIAAVRHGRGWDAVGIGSVFLCFDGVLLRSSAHGDPCEGDAVLL